MVYFTIIHTRHDVIHIERNSDFFKQLLKIIFVQKATDTIPGIFSENRTVSVFNQNIIFICIFDALFKIYIHSFKKIIMKELWPFKIIFFLSFTEKMSYNMYVWCFFQKNETSRSRNEEKFFKKN